MAFVHSDTTKRRRRTTCMACEGRRRNGPLARTRRSVLVCTAATRRAQRSAKHRLVGTAKRTRARLDEKKKMTTTTILTAIFRTARSVRWMRANLVPRLENRRPIGIRLTTDGIAAKTVTATTRRSTLSMIADQKCTGRCDGANCRITPTAGPLAALRSSKVVAFHNHHRNQPCGASSTIRMPRQSWSTADGICSRRLDLPPTRPQKPTLLASPRLRSPSQRLWSARRRGPSSDQGENDRSNLN